jgi:PmbA protein
LKGAFDSFELCFTRERVKKYEVAEGRLLSTEVKEEEGMSLRGVKDGRMAFSYTFEKGEKAVDALVENATLIFPFLERDRYQAFPEKQIAYPKLTLYDDSGLRLDAEEKIAALIGMESAIRGFDRRIAATRNCELYESELEIGIVNSNGLEAEGKKTVYTLGGMAVAADGGDEVSWYDWIWNTHYDGLDFRVLGNRIAEKALSFLSAEVIDTGTYDGLLRPGCVCQLLDILSPSFLGENLFKSKTRLEGKEGQEVVSRLLTITDSGTRGIDAFPFDGEGVSCRENVLIRNGCFQGFLYDTYYGRALGRESTGNSVRSGIKIPPRCGTTGLFVENGSGEGIDGFDNGLIIDELMGTHTANSVTGDFSVGAVGHYCRKGSQIPFKGVILAGNLFEVLVRVRAVGNDLAFYGSHGAPTLVVEGLKISGR